MANRRVRDWLLYFAIGLPLVGYVAYASVVKDMLQERRNHDATIALVQAASEDLGQSLNGDPRFADVLVGVGALPVSSSSTGGQGIFLKVTGTIAARDAESLLKEVSDFCGHRPRFTFSGQLQDFKRWNPVHQTNPEGPIPCWIATYPSKESRQE